MKSLTLKTVSRSTSDIIVDINLSLFSDNVISSIDHLLRTLEVQRILTLSKPNSDNIILFFSDEMSLKNVYRAIVKLIIESQDPEILEYIQGALSNIKAVNISNPEKLENPVFISLSILFSGENFCKLQLPSNKYFMKNPLADIVSSYLESCGSIEIPFPDFNDDEITISFHDLRDAISFEMFIATDLL